MQEEVVRPVPTPLAPYVSSLHGYLFDGLPAGTHVGMPSRTITLVLDLDGPLRMTLPGGRTVALRTLVGGLHDAPVHIHHDGRQHGIQAALTPAGVRALLGRPAAELAGLVVGLDDVLGAAGRRLPEQLDAATGWDARLGLVEDLLLERLAASARPAGPPDEVREAWAVLSRRHGDVPVAAVARHVGWSARHLTQRFTGEFGLRPKQAARVMRFERSSGLLRQAAGRRSLAEVAALCGYSDQAHLTREWQVLAGTTPGRWPVEDVLANLQDESPGAARE